MFSIISSLIHLPLNTVKTLIGSYTISGSLKLTSMSSSESTTDSISTHSTLGEFHPALNNQVVDRKGLTSSIKLATLAAEEFDEGDKEFAFSMYQVALAKMIKSFPTNDVEDEILREKLTSMGKKGGTTNSESSLNVNKSDNQQIDQMASASILRKPTSLIIEDNKLPQLLECQPQQQQQQNETPSIVLYLLLKLKDVAMFTTKLIARGTALAVQSPLTRLVSKSVNSLVKSIFWINKKTEFSTKAQSICVKCLKRVFEGEEIYQLFEFACKAIYSLVKLIIWISKKTQLSKKVRSLTVKCIKKILEGDKLYQLYEFVSEVIHCLIVACIKAIVAYKETPGYDQTFLQAWTRSFYAATMTM